MKLLRLILYTLAWCLFLPLFFWKNRANQSGRNPFLEWRAIKRIGRKLKRFNIVGAWEIFWSNWNPGVTMETTKPLYEMCGGNKRPFISTMVVFLYSGVFLHALFMVVSWVHIIKTLTGDSTYFTRHFAVRTVILYLAFGLPVALYKKWRLYKINSRRISLNPTRTRAVR